MKFYKIAPPNEENVLIVKLSSIDASSTFAVYNQTHEVGRVIFFIELNKFLPYVNSP